MSDAGAAAASLRLEVVAGAAAGASIAVGERLVFGRQSDGDGALGEDPELSRHHAEIARRPDGVYVIDDLSSTNGTFVNRTRVQAPTPLSLGDLIDLGTTRLIVREVPAAPGAEPAVDVRAATVIVELPQPPAVEPEPEPQPEPAEPAPALELRVRLDPDRGEAEIGLAEDGPSVRFRLQDGRWQMIEGVPDE